MRTAAALTIAVVALIGTGFLLDRGDVDTAYAAVAVEDIEHGFGAADFDAALADADAKVSRKRARMQAAPGQWLHQEILALALMERHRLGGDAADLEEAAGLLEDGLRLAPEPSGPSLSQAALALDWHDLESAQRALDRFDRSVAPHPRDRAEALALHGDIAFQKGALSEASEWYRKTTDLRASTGGVMRQAQVALWSGDPDRAIRISETSIADRRSAPADFAMAALMLANLSYAKGDLARARDWIDAANSRFANYWLGETYLAQQIAAEGQVEEGIARLKAIADETGEPSVMDALTGFLLHAGRTEEAELWSARSARRWDALMKDHPDAYRLHAAEHHLDFGDPAKALELSRQEIAKRPFGEAIEVHASALIANARPAEALGWLERAEANGWQSVSLDLARAEALAELGRDSEAERFVARARSINPDALDPVRKLIRFGHF